MWRIPLQEPKDKRGSFLVQPFDLASYYKNIQQPQRFGLF